MVAPPPEALCLPNSKSAGEHRQPDYHAPAAAKLLVPASLAKREFAMRLSRLLVAGFVATFSLAESAAAEEKSPVIGVCGQVGCRANAKRIQRLTIDKPGVYENLLIDGEWLDSTLVKITADNVTLRNCEIRHGRHNALTIVAKNVVIDSCRIHRVLAGTYADQNDAHGITGRPTNLTIRNCDIGLTSGDSIQFDPGRGAWGNVLVENCTLWTSPLPEDAAGFKRGERPGENAIDTKQRASNPRSKLTIRNCLMYGWNQPSQISNMAALNLKNHVEARVENCLFRDNEIAFRVRGGTGEYGGAQVAIENCAVYDSQVAIRAEDGLNLRPAARHRRRSPAEGGPGRRRRGERFKLSRHFPAAQVRRRASRRAEALTGAFRTCVLCLR
jgi:hypothetical protein